MTTQYKTKAFVFKKSDRNEADRVFSVFTNDFGRLDIFAKAIRKITSKLRSNIDIFYFSDIEFIQGKAHKTLIDAAKINKFDDINMDLNKLEVVRRVSDILDGFIRGQEKDSATFDLLDEFLIKLGNSKVKNYQLAYQYFFWNFISLQGYKLEVNNCAVCKLKLNPYNVYNFCHIEQPVASSQAQGRESFLRSKSSRPSEGNYINPAILRRSPEATSNLREIVQESRSDGDFYFSNKEGGIICGTCAGLKKTCPEPCQRINSDIAKTLRLIFRKDWQTISKLKIEPSSQKLLEDLSKNAVHTFCPVHC